MSDDINPRSYSPFRLYEFFGRPILALPEGSAHFRLKCWNQYRAFTYKRWLVKRTMQLLALLYLDGVLCRRMTCPLDDGLAFDLPAWLDHVRGKIGHPCAVPVVVWPPQINRGRVYVHLLDESGDCVAFAKISFDDCNDACLAAEVQALKVLQVQIMQSCHVAGLLAEGEWQGHRHLVLQSVPENTQQCPASLNAMLSDCISEFSGESKVFGVSELASLEWWQEFRREGAVAFPAFAYELEGLIAECSGLPVCRVHGDFGPANLLASDDGFWIMDWEESDADGPILTDSIGYELAMDLKAVRKHPEKTLERFMRSYFYNQSPAGRRDAMAALAFRHTVLPLESEPYLKCWNSTLGRGEV